jgi:hypothetical protein
MTSNFNVKNFPSEIYNLLTYYLIKLNMKNEGLHVKLHVEMDRIIQRNFAIRIFKKL